MKISTRNILKARRIEAELTEVLKVETQEFRNKIENRYINKYEVEEILHDIKNPLTAIKVSLQNLEGKKIDKNISLALESAKEIEMITESKNSYEKFSIFEEIKTVGIFLNKKDKINLNFQGRNSNLKGNSLKFRRVVQNILINSIDANTKSKITKVGIQVQSNNNNVQIIFIDNHKMNKHTDSNKNIEKIFNKGYSDKDNYQNKGLGLYICKKIIEEEFHGKISADINKNLQFNVKIVIPIV